MKERIASFGRNGNLVGIVTEPGSPPPPSRPSVVILNTGQTHKVGTFGMTVELARSLAADGFRAMRFDLSALGDSRMRMSRETGEDIPVNDARDALDFVGGGAADQRVLLVGLCSGSDNAHRISLADERVVGAVHLDAVGYRTPKYYAKFLGRRALSPQFLKRQLDPRTRGAMLQRQIAPGAPAANAYERHFPPMEKMGEELGALMARRLRLLYVYTRGAHLYTNYRDQLRDTFPTVDFGDRLEVELYPVAEHTFLTLHSRATVLNRITSWTKRYFGGAA